MDAASLHSTLSSCATEVRSADSTTPACSIPPREFSTLCRDRRSGASHRPRGKRPLSASIEVRAEIAEARIDHNGDHCCVGAESLSHAQRSDDVRSR
jgi:hypothetical protein